MRDDDMDTSLLDEVARYLRDQLPVLVLALLLVVALVVLSYLHIG